MIINIDSKYIQSFEYESSINSDGSVLGTCELGTATIQMINDSNTYSSLKGTWIKTIHGSFYIHDVEPVQEKVNIKLSCYDVKYKLDSPYDSSKYTFPMTLKQWRNAIFTNCGVIYDNSDFPNCDLELKDEPYIGDNPSNRQVISQIAQAGASFVITDEEDKFYFRWFKNTNHNITDWLELTTEKESTSAVNTVVLGRGDVEDNVYYPQVLPDNPKEIRIDNNYILDPQIEGEVDRRYSVIEPIYNQVNGFSFIPFNIRTQEVKNKLSIRLGDKVSYVDIWGNNLTSYVMTKKISYLGGEPTDDNNYEITLSAEEIKETSTEYSYASSVEDRLNKVEITTDKQNKKISAIVETQEEQSQKLAQIELDNKSITAKVSESETKIISLEQSIPKYQAELDIYNITIPVDNTKKPIENKDYLIGYKTTFENNEVESLVSSQSSCAGITFGLSNNKINLSVLISTAITNLTNEFVIDFSYSKESTTYTDSKKIIVSLSLKGENGSKGDKGDKGEKGDQGEQGIQGEKGLKGDTGEKGDTGSPGKDGTNGTNGKDGKDGTSYYVYIRYSSNSNGNPMTEAPTSSSKYMGIASSTSSTAPTSYSSYKWSLIKGADGTNGVNGKDGTNGINGKNSYFHIKYSNDGVNFTANDGNDVGRYIGSYTDFNETASTNFSDYSWQDTAIVVDEELNDLQNQINDTNKDLNNNYTNNTELNQKLEEQKTTIMTTVNTTITQTKESWQADVVKYINENGVEKFVNTLVTIDADGLKLSKSDEDIVSLLNNKGLYVSDGKLREDLANLLMKVDRTGALFKLLEILGTIREQGVIQKEKITDEKFGECQAWYWIGSD